MMRGNARNRSYERQSLHARSLRVVRVVRHMAPLLVFLVLLLLSGCEQAVVLNTKGSIGSDERSLIVTAALLMLIVAGPVFFLTFYFGRKYRASNTKAKYSPEWSHSRGVEIVMWLVPVLIIAVLGTIVWTSSHRLDPYRSIDTPGEPIAIEAISLDWKWLFIYPDLGIASVNEVAFPEDVQASFRITSDTVMNSFFIPQLGSQVYAMTGMITQLHLLADATGDYHGMSANFSGDGFSEMEFTAVVGTREEFDAWVSRVRESADTLDWERYVQLEAPSHHDQVTYFSSVDDGLFEAIVTEYMRARPVSEE